eukprot:CAMPEP_0197046020 /NCGR_PEP_ID=MMETSP1384-20130603/21786_1 /TAXON_ID=29189 /ORGANISM="Ammonia sp." /LENGTH=214 /DNA_ID=CAMNT_0042477725 /DNA_START=9 /DNA_END=653 /DNA_ORIENTATION=+
MAILVVLSVVTLSASVLGVHPEGGWIEFDNTQNMGYPSYRLLDLSGGTDVNDYTYVAPGNIAEVESSVKKWPNNDYYFLSSVFDGSLNYRTHGNRHEYTHWLGQCSSSEVATITIKFAEPQDISHVVVAPNTLASLSNRRSWYAIDAFTDIGDYGRGDENKAVHITQMVNTDEDYFGKVRAHDVRGTYDMLVFYLLKKGTYCCLNEIQIFVNDD